MTAIVRLLCVALAMMLAAPAAARVEITVYTDMANRLLAIACSNRPVDETVFRNSPVLANQLAHHGRFGPQFSLDAYLAGLREAAACRVPDPDPFRFAALVREREKMTRAIAFLEGRRDDLAGRVAVMLEPYVPAGTDFSGGVVLAAASFSCGGFARGGSFFVDIPCLADNIEGEYEAVVRLVAHETYHAIQARFMPDPVPAEVATPNQGLEAFFHNLAIEGSASHVGSTIDVPGEGAYATYSRRLAARNVGHLAYNFRLLDYVTELLGQPHPEYGRRFEELMGLAFAGAFDQLGYFAGEQMAAEIARDYGPAGLACVLALPPENFVLAYDRALAQAPNLDRSTPFAPPTVEAARRLAAGRGALAGLTRCLRPAPTS